MVQKAGREDSVCSFHPENIKGFFHSCNSRPGCYSEISELGTGMELEWNGEWNVLSCAGSLLP